MEQKREEFQIELKAGITDEGTFEGFLSWYGNVDSHGDVVQPGAFTKTLKDGGTRRPLLWQHDPAKPIGYVDLQDTAKGLKAIGKLLLSTQDARDAYEFMKAGIVKGLSIGYKTIRENTLKEYRDLLELKLFEASVVTFGSNSLAVVTAVKAEPTADELAFKAALEEFRKMIPRQSQRRETFLAY